ncbi:unnamed protein product [Brachionus calyciflorus]|uniref:Snake toxin/toxin-like domain-containing protein n=1 Tax=Brachionus calyciflorus TaxID=104777 RepID=A0A814PW49_9BILA|nr:unnamed protein product [Brachionus calyciflorus]
MKFVFVTWALVLSCLIYDSMPLLCYECIDCDNSLEIVKNCTSLDAYCSKTISSAFGYTTVSKRCSSVCTQDIVSFMGVTSETSCCRTDLCSTDLNFATSIKNSSNTTSKRLSLKSGHGILPI